MLTELLCQRAAGPYRRTAPPWKPGSIVRPELFEDDYNDGRHIVVPLGLIVSAIGAGGYVLW